MVEQCYGCSSRNDTHGKRASPQPTNGWSCLVKLSQNKQQLLGSSCSWNAYRMPPFKWYVADTISVHHTSVRTIIKNLQTINSVVQDQIDGPWKMPPSYSTSWPSTFYFDFKLIYYCYSSFVPGYVKFIYLHPCKADAWLWKVAIQPEWNSFVSLLQTGLLCSIVKCLAS